MLTITLRLLPEEAEQASLQLRTWLATHRDANDGTVRVLDYLAGALLHNAAMADAEVARRAGERRQPTKRAAAEPRGRPRAPTGGRV